jgi:hypothetical protein
MEPILIASYTEMLKAHPNSCSVDRILEDPVMRSEFLTRVSAVQRSEYDILRAPQSPQALETPAPRRLTTSTPAR